MKQFFALITKEFYHVLRDRKTLLILIGMPVMQILIFGFALTNEIKNANIVVLDNAKDQVSQAIIAKIAASPFFKIESTIVNDRQLEPTFRKGNIKLAIIFPNKFSHDLLHQGQAQVQIIADATDPNTATTLTNYLSNIIGQYATDQWGSSSQNRIIPIVRMLYNPELDAAPNFVPGVIALVLMLVCVLMTAVSIVKEKETGTMEVLLVSPFKPILVIVSKTVPYLLLSLVNVCTILLLSVFVLHLPIKGNLFLLLAESILFIITCLSIGILISIKTKTQQFAMLLSLMGMLLPTILFSGFLFPIENMPIPLQIFSNIIPAKWFYIIVKSIMIKGLGIASIWKETLILVTITVILLGISLQSFKVRLE